MNSEALVAAVSVLVAARDELAANPGVDAVTYLDALAGNLRDEINRRAECQS